MMIVSVDEARSYLAVDHHEDDALITALIDAAEAFIESQVSVQTSELPSRAKTIARVLVLQLVSSWYDERTPSTPEVGDVAKRLLYAIALIMRTSEGDV